MTDTSKIEDRLRKLLRLAQDNPSQEEAAAAFALAQEMAQRAGLDLDDLAAPEEEQRPEPEPMQAIEHRRIDAWGKATAWRLNIGGAVAKANGCEHYRFVGGSEAGLYFYGQPRDIDTAAIIYHAIVSQIEGMATRAVLTYKNDPEHDPRHDESPRVYGAAWRLGCAATVARRLPSRAATIAKARAEVEAARQLALASSGDLAPSCHALVRVERADEIVAKVAEAVKDYGKKTLRLRSGGGVDGGEAARGSSRGFGDGARAGHGVSLGSAGALPAGRGSR